MSNVKEEAINKAYEDRLDDEHYKFEDQVKSLVDEIERLSDALRDRKRDLLKLEFDMPVRSIP